MLDITTIYNQWRSTTSLNFGLRLARTASTNNLFNMFASSSAQTNRPELDVYYTPQANDSIPKLKWPLSVARSSLKVNLPFGGRSTLQCNDGTYKEHNGVDYNAVHGTAVYATEDGIVKEVTYDHKSGVQKWAYNVVLEHTSPTGGKYTTVSWHVNPLSGVTETAFIPRGMPIATVADLGSNTHFHFGVRIGAYVTNLSGLGGVPYATHPCDGYPVFPAGFVNPESQLNVIFQ
jgi:murein DD-endopeptidase MepM/ murein hydrolase activator NlpD